MAMQQIVPTPKPVHCAKQIQVYRFTLIRRSLGSCKALTRGPGDDEGDLEDVAPATAGQVDDEWGRPPVASRSDAHGDAVGLLVDLSGQLVPQVVQGPPPEMERDPVLLGLGEQRIGARLHAPNPPPRPRLATEHDDGEVFGEAGLQLSHEEPWLYSGDQRSRVLL